MYLFFLQYNDSIYPINDSIKNSSLPPTNTPFQPNLKMTPTSIKKTPPTPESDSLPVQEAERITVPQVYVSEELEMIELQDDYHPTQC